MSPGATPLRGVRIPDALWAAFGRWCSQRGTTRSEALRVMITNEIGDFHEA